MQGQRRTPLTCGNPIIEKLVQERDKRKLGRMLRDMKPTVDSSPPQRACAFGKRKDFGYQMRMARRARSEDVKMVDSIMRTMSRTFTLPPDSSAASLNFDRRREQLREITNANLKLLERLESTKSQYSRKELDSEYMQSQRYVFNSSFSLRKRFEEIVRLRNSVHDTLGTHA